MEILSATKRRATAIRYANGNDHRTMWRIDIETPDDIKQSSTCEFGVFLNWLDDVPDLAEIEVVDEAGDKAIVTAAYMREAVQKFSEFGQMGTSTRMSGMPSFDAEVRAFGADPAAYAGLSYMTLCRLIREYGERARKYRNRATEKRDGGAREAAEVLMLVATYYDAEIEAVRQASADKAPNPLRS